MLKYGVIVLQKYGVIVSRNNTCYGCRGNAVSLNTSDELLLHPVYFNQFRNVLECYEETTVRRPAAATYIYTHTHKKLFTSTTVTTQGSYMK